MPQNPAPPSPPPWPRSFSLSPFRSGTAHADAKGKCIGANACKGKSDCGGKDGCGGQNACKGQGYLALTKAECDKIPGTTFEAE